MSRILGFSRHPPYHSAIRPIPLPNRSEIVTGIQDAGKKRGSWNRPVSLAIRSHSRHPIHPVNLDRGHASKDIQDVSGSGSHKGSWSLWGRPWRTC